MGEALKVLKVYIRPTVYSIVYTFRGDTARQEVETSSGVSNFSITSDKYNRKLRRKKYINRKINIS
jgi:hypothetical protein